VTFLVILFVIISVAFSLTRPARRRKSARRAPISDAEFVRRLASIPGAQVSRRGGQTIINIGGAPDLEAHRSHLPEITWVHEFKPPEKCVIQYVDAGGAHTERHVYMARRGLATNGREYIGVYEDGKFKTFRTDRVKEIEIVDG